MSDRKLRDKIRKALGRQSVNVEDRRGETFTPTIADLMGATPGAISDWDLLHQRHLMNRKPVDMQGMDFPIVEPERLSQVLQPNDPEGQAIAARMGGGIANPGTLLQAQAVNRHLQDTAQPGLMSGPPTDASWPTASRIEPEPLGNWGPSYPTVTEGRSDRFRPGLRYAPWNMTNG